MSALRRPSLDRRVLQVPKEIRVIKVIRETPVRREPSETKVTPATPVPREPLANRATLETPATPATPAILGTLAQPASKETVGARVKRAAQLSSSRIDNSYALGVHAREGLALRARPPALLPWTSLRPLSGHALAGTALRSI